jgi:spermidine synthase
LPAAVVEAVDFGTAELAPDRSGAGRGWTLLVDGVPQSHVYLDDPTRLQFEYVRRLATVIDRVAAPHDPIRVLHLGGGALCLPRYIAATRPGSAQDVVERDGALVDLVRRVLPLPPDAGDLRIHVEDARAAVEAADGGGYHLVIADVYHGAQMPAAVAGVEFAAEVARVLRPDGLYAVNVTDLPPLVLSRIQVATLREVFADVCLVAARTMLRGRRYGNVVMVAAKQTGRLPIEGLAGAAMRDAVPGRLVHGEELDRFVGGTRPATQTPA